MVRDGEKNTQVLRKGFSGVLALTALAAGGILVAGCQGAMATDGESVAGYDEQSSPQENVAQLDQESIGQVNQAVTGFTSVAWADEFNGTSLDTSIWTYNHEAYFNSELQDYVNESENNTYNIVEVSNGTLKIHARHYPGGFWSDSRNATSYYRSGRIITKNKQEVLYGTVEARLRVPTAYKNGLWPAFWMLGNRISETPVVDPDEIVTWPLDGANEIDIWEWASSWNHEDSNLIAGTAPQNYAPFPGWPKSVSLDVSNWHVWKLVWTPTTVSLYRDATLLGTANNNTNTVNGFSDHMYTILNLAVGGNLGGTVDPTMTWPQTLEVDYVRYTPDGSGGGGGGGGGGVGTTIQAEAHSSQSGTQNENGNTTVGYFDAGDYLAFSNIDLNGVTGIDMSVAGALSGGVMDVRVGSCSGQVLGSYTMVATGGWGSWANRQLSFSSTASGTHTLYLCGAVGGGILNIDNFTLTGNPGGGGGGGGSNILANPNFASGLTDWDLYVANGEDSITTDAGAARFNSQPPEQAAWNMQLMQTFNLNSGDNYTFGVDLETTGSNSRTVSIRIQENGGDYTQFGANTCAVPGSGTIRCEVTATVSQSVPTKFVIEGAESEWDFRVDNASAVKN